MSCKKGSILWGRKTSSFSRWDRSPGRRNSIGAKSPLSDGFAESEAGGFWGAELKKSGFDAVIIEGRSEKPVFLRIKDGQAEIYDAGALWGMEVAQTVRNLQQRFADVRLRVTAIGPAGNTSAEKTTHRKMSSDEKIT